MIADVGLWHRTTLSAPTTQLKKRRAYLELLKFDASSWASKAYSPDENWTSGWLKRWMKKN